MQVCVPQAAVSALFSQLSTIQPSAWPYPVMHKQCELLFRIQEQSPDDTVRITPVIDIAETPGVPVYHERNGAFLFGTILFVPHLKQIVRFSDESKRLLSLHWHKPKCIKRSGLNTFLQENISVFSTPDTVPDSSPIDLFQPPTGNNFARLVDMPLINKFEKVELQPHGADRDWLYLSATYAAGPCTISLVDAHCKIVMTGTPIENSIADIKSLFDLVLPGYLGSDNDFQERFIQPIESSKVPHVRERLTRLLSPFLLRRLKESVISELPEKTEEISEYPLSDEQASMYHEVLTSRGKEVIVTLKDDEKPIPYIHIFTVLNLLKEICCHPALLLKKTESYASHSSAKWDLFVELLNESLSSGRKVVVFTQFLGMVEILKAYLKAINCNHVVLTGASKKRGAIIDSFNNDPVCKVIVCSLKAAGVGIDLTAASVVIHYDRWWNASREDQATDRVHRIGQKNPVLVFKLVTTSTPEEKIHALILAKKDLSDTVVGVDEPDRLKAFDRQELLSLFSAPEAVKQ